MSSRSKGEFQTAVGDDGRSQAQLLNGTPPSEVEDHATDTCNGQAVAPARLGPKSGQIHQQAIQRVRPCFRFQLQADRFQSVATVYSGHEVVSQVALVG